MNDSRLHWFQCTGCFKNPPVCICRSRRIFFHISVFVKNIMCITSITDHFMCYYFAVFFLETVITTTPASTSANPITLNSTVPIPPVNGSVKPFLLITFCVRVPVNVFSPFLNSWLVSQDNCVLSNQKKISCILKDFPNYLIIFEVSWKWHN